MVTPENIRSTIVVDNCACVFIDDTGSQGQKQNIPHLPDDRYSWVGVVVPPTKGERVLTQMDNCVDLIKQEYGVQEYHFVEILGGKAGWKGVDINERIGIFDAFANLFNLEEFAIFNQTLWEENEFMEKVRAEIPKSGDFDLNKPTNASLMYLLFRIRGYLRENGWRQAIVVVDEGPRKAESIMQQDWLRPEVKDGAIWFASSEAFAPLQLADFAAYSLNRIQVLCGKENPSITDKCFLLAVQPMMGCYKNAELRWRKF